MVTRYTLDVHEKETRLFSRRAIVVIILVLLFAFALILRLGYLQIIKHKLYSTLSRNNILTVIPLMPNRGLIYDRNGVLLAKDIPVFNLDVTPARVKNMNATIKALSQIIKITPGETQTFHRIAKEYRPYQPVPLKLKLTPLQVAKFYVNRYRFPGVSIQPQMIRYYPLGKITSNVIGYVGRISAAELQHVNPENYNASTYIGKVGIEKYYEPLLHGTVGAEEVETNAEGRIVRVLKRIPPIPGTNIYLTLDSKLQTFALKALGNDSGAVVVLQPQTGAVLAMVSKPTYNPNPFVTGLTLKAYQALLHAPHHPLVNRDVRGLYSPGSTIKPFYAVGGLNNGVITKHYRIYDPGWFRLPHTKHVFHDWKYNGHGWVDVSKAITVSCDTFFYNLAVMMGINRMDKVLHRFGFGQKTGIDLPGELPGIVPSPHWKITMRDKPWYTGDTIIAGIGQGALVVTPLQLAVSTAIIALHGKHIKPHLLMKTQQPGGISSTYQPQILPPVTLHNPQIWSTVATAMAHTVTSIIGTALGFGRHPGYTIAAKTGTAQVFGNYRDEERDRTNIPKRLRNNYLFILFAPIKHPKIVLAIVVEHASFADRIARKIVDFYFNELKARHQSTAAKPAIGIIQLPLPK